MITVTGTIVASVPAFKGDGWRLAVRCSGTGIATEFYTRPRAPIARDAAQQPVGRVVTLTGSKEGNRRAYALDGINIEEKH